MQELWQSIKDIPYSIGYTMLDFLEWILNLFPPVTFDLNQLVNSIPFEVLGMLVYIHFFQGLGIIAVAYGIRAILLIFGR